MWKQRADVRTLDEIVTTNVILWLKRRVAAKKVEHRVYTLNTLAGELLPYLVTPEKQAEADYDPAREQNRIRKALETYLGSRGKVAWRLDYLDALCRALDLRPQALLVPEPSLSLEELALLDSMEASARWLRWKAGK